MSHPYNGKRKGISLVEMMITVILFAALATIGLKYTKNFFDTGLASQKARIAALMDQATQLVGGYQVFVAQQGSAPLLLSDLNDTNVSILTKLPPVIDELSTQRWDLNTSTGFGSGKAIHLYLDGNKTANDDNVYCAIFNHEFNKSIDLNVTDANYQPGLAATYYANGFTSFCYGSALGAPGTALHIMVMVP